VSSRLVVPLGTAGIRGHEGRGRGSGVRVYVMFAGASPQALCMPQSARLDMDDDPHPPPTLHLCIPSSLHPRNSSIPSIILFLTTPPHFVPSFHHLSPSLRTDPQTECRSGTLPRGSDSSDDAVYIARWPLEKDDGVYLPLPPLVLHRTTFGTHAASHGTLSSTFGKQNTPSTSFPLFSPPFDHEKFRCVCVCTDICICTGEGSNRPAIRSGNYCQYCPRSL
jgi:hypothetical protein